MDALPRCSLRLSRSTREAIADACRLARLAGERGGVDSILFEALQDYRRRRREGLRARGIDPDAAPWPEPLDRVRGVAPTPAQARGLVAIPRGDLGALMAGRIDPCA